MQLPTISGSKCRWYPHRMHPSSLPNILRTRDSFLLVIFGFILHERKAREEILWWGKDAIGQQIMSWNLLPRSAHPPVSQMKGRTTCKIALRVMSRKLQISYRARDMCCITANHVFSRSCSQEVAKLPRESPGISRTCERSSLRHAEKLSGALIRYGKQGTEL